MVAKRRPGTRSRTSTTGQRRRHAFERRALTPAIRSTEPLAGHRRTAAPTLATLPTPARAARPDRDVAAAPATIVVVGAATADALATATAIAVAIRPHLDDDRRPFVFERRRRRGCDSKLLEVRKLLQQRFLETLGHPFS